MSDRAIAPLVAFICFLGSIFLALQALIARAPLSEWVLPLFLLLLGVGAALWGWLRARPIETPLPKQPSQELTIITPLPPPPLVQEVATSAVVEVAKPPDTTELLPQVVENLGLSAEEMAIQKPSTPQTTTSFDESQLEESVRKAEAMHAEKEAAAKERDDTRPTRPERPVLAFGRTDDETQPDRNEKPLSPSGLSAEEMAIQKPFTPHATERLNDAEMEEALNKAKARGEATKPTFALSAEQMASDKPETTESTRKISRSLLPPTSTREMASNKPQTEVSTHEIEGTIEAEAATSAAPEGAAEPAVTLTPTTPEGVGETAAQMIEERPETPLSTIEASIEPGALLVDTPLIDLPSPAAQVMEVEAAPVVLGRHQDTEDTLEVTTAEVAAEGPLNHDDLTKIEGIGPKISAILIAAGISTFSRLATTPEEELRDILKRAGLRLAPTLDTWAQQAAVAARGAWDELTALQEKIGRAPDHPRDDENKKTGEE